MFNQCCVVNCGSRRKAFKLYRIPKTEIGLQYWLKCVPSGSQNLDSELHKLYVCEKHFEKKFISAKYRLRRGAYPTLFTDEDIVRGAPVNTAIDPLIDHGYFKTSKHNDHMYCKPSTSMGSDMDVLPTRSPLHQKMDTALLSDTEMEVLPPSSLSHQEIDKASISGVQQGSLTPKKLRYRKRLLHKTASLSPKYKRLYMEYKKSRRQLNFYKRAENAMKFTKEKIFSDITNKMTPVGRKILFMQLKQLNRKIKGRRFTDEEKLISLSVLKQSPKCYHFLKKIFILPSKQTLNKFVSTINMEVGINTHIFDAIKQEVKTWDENKKYCSILFDEVALEPGLSYNKSKDLIEGFVELDVKTSELADHSLVFMLRGAVQKWQQPIAFYFCKGSTKSINLKNIIKQVVAAVNDTGLIPVALVCDQGTSFQSALRNLQEETKRQQINSGSRVIDEVIILSGHNLNIIYDPPHLLKGLRNNFLNKNIKFENNICKWSDIVDVYKTDCKQAQMRLLHKLNDEHILPEKIKKMKVKNCVRVFSKTMAAALSYTSQFSNYTDGTAVSGSLGNTAELVAFLDDLFDSVNGASLLGKKTRGKPLRTAVTKNSPHPTFWKEAIIKLRNIRFIDNKGREIFVPSQKNWIVTLNSYIRLWNFFNEKNLKFMRPRYYNSDPLENFFGQVRAYNYRNNNPDCKTFKNTFKSLLITRFIQFHSDGFNCEEDAAEQLLKLQFLFKACNSSPPNVNNENRFGDELLSGCSVGSSNSRNINPENFRIQASQERLNVHSQAYTAGWVVRNVFKKIRCSTCEANLIANEEQTVHKWISLREYKTIKKHKLTYPSEKAVSLFHYTTKIAIEYLECRAHKKDVSQNIKNRIYSKYSTGFFTCERHSDITDHFLDYSIRLTIYNWVNTINKILKGTDICRLPKSLPSMQMQAYNKYKSKLKNKIK